MINYVFVKHPDPTITTTSVDGITYYPDTNGIFKVDVNHLQNLLGHGFVETENVKTENYGSVDYQPVHVDAGKTRKVRFNKDKLAEKQNHVDLTQPTLNDNTEKYQNEVLLEDEKLKGKKK